MKGCLEENTILAVAERRLAPDGRAEVEAHLAGCAACRELVALAVPGSEGPAATSTEVQASAVAMAPLAVALGRAQAARRIGQTLSGRWTIDRMIGAGGMGQVFAATHRNGRRVAIKMMRPELAMHPEVVRRFLREGYVANKIEHPGTVAILDDDTADDGAPFLVMELLVGRSLGAVVEEEGPLPVARVVALGRELLSVLAAAHRASVVHRDIKPDNIFLTSKGELKVLDFGIAQLREQLRDEGTTLDGMTIGTVGYMPPEQARGQSQRVDARADVWAVAATLYTLLSGHRLHEGAETPNEQLLLAMTAPVPPMRTLLPAAPAALCEILDRALAFDCEHRFRDAGAMLEPMTRLDLGPRTGPIAFAPTLANPTLPLTPIPSGPPGPVAAPGTWAAVTATPPPAFVATGGPKARGREARIALGVGGIVLLGTLIGVVSAAVRSGNDDRARPTSRQAATTAAAPPSAEHAPPALPKASPDDAGAVAIPSASASASPPLAAKAPSTRATAPRRDPPRPAETPAPPASASRPAPERDPLGVRR